MPPYNLNLHIDQLVLHGFAAGDRHSISAAIQQELTRLFTEQGVPRSLTQTSDLPQLNGGEIQITPRMQPSAIGVQIAQSLYGGFSE
jgi:hypothetical protein